MTIQPTPLFFKGPINKLVEGISPPAYQVGEKREPMYLFGGKTLDSAKFGFAADLDAPDGPSWTQLLFEAPYDLAAIASLIVTNRLANFELASATDWDKNPQIDISKLRSFITTELRRYARRIKYRQNKKVISVYRYYSFWKIILAVRPQKIQKHIDIIEHRQKKRQHTYENSLENEKPMRSVGGLSRKALGRARNLG